MKAPTEDFLATVLPEPVDMGGIRGQLPQLVVVPSQILLCSEKFVLNI